MSLAELLDLLRHDFMQRALLAALLTGLAAPAIGTFLVQRRLALLGDGIGHVAVTGVALGLLTGTSPTWTAVVVAILGAVLIEVIREQGHTNGDVALALLFYGGLAGGVLSPACRRGRGQPAGLPLRVGDEHQRHRGLVHRRPAVVVLTLTLGLLPQLFAVASDPEFARVAGLRVRSYNLLVAVLAAVSVTVAMRTVGLLLVSALMVVPVATSQQLARSFRSTLLAAMVLGGVAAVGGPGRQRLAVRAGDRGPRPLHRAARAGDVRRDLAGGGLAAPTPTPGGALPHPRGRVSEAPTPPTRTGSPATTTGARPRARRRLRPPRGAPRRPRRLRPRRAPARAPRRAL